MKKISEINLKTETIRSPVSKNLNIEQMKSMFGRRINSAIIYNDNIAYLVHVKMVRLCKKWKFWNKDILEAYKRYVGYILM